MYGIDYFVGNIYNFIAIILSFAVMIAGSITDFKKREVADFVNFGLFFSAIALRLLYSIFMWDYWILLEGLAGFTVFFLLGLALFYSGQWGGGDSKMIIGLGVLFGLPLNPITTLGVLNSLLVAFIINSFIAGSFYGLGWSAFLAIKDKKKFMRQWNKINSKKCFKNFQIISIFLILLFIISGYFYSSLMYFIALLIFSFLVLIYLFNFAKSVEKCQMFQDMKVKANSKNSKLDKLTLLTEGEWIAKDVKYKGEYICGPKDLGITKEQINKLRKLGIEKVPVKVGIPFVPSFLLGMIITMFFGNLLTYFLFMF